MKNTRLKDVLAPVERSVEVDPVTSYRFLGVRSFGGGCFDAGEREGSETRYRTLNRVVVGDFVYPKLMAWEGAFGVVPPALDGYFVSPEFCTFRADDSVLDVRYLDLLFRWPETWRTIAGGSIGTNLRRRRLYPAAFFEKSVHLPGLAEQQRMAERLGRISSDIDGVRALRVRALQIGGALPGAAAHRPDLSIKLKQEAGWSLTTLADVMAPASEKVQVEADASYPNVGVLSFGRGLFEKSPIEGAATSAKALFRIRDGQFIYSRLFAFEGAYTYVEPRFDGFFVSNEFPTFDIDPERLDVVFLAAYFSAPAVWSELARSSKGLGLRRQRVHPDAILATNVWLPPLGEQQRIRSVVERAHEIARLRHDTTKHVNALFPAVLSSTFT